MEDRLENGFEAWIERQFAREKGLRFVGVFVVRWEAEWPEQTRAPDGSETRMARWLKAIAMKVAKLSGAVAGWTLAGTSLTMAAAFRGEDGEDRDTFAGRMAFLIRDTAKRILTDYRCPESELAGGGLRCGFGWAAEPPERTGERKPWASAWGSALLGACEQAWQNLLFSPSPIVRLPLPATYENSPGPGFSVRYLPIFSLLDGSLYGYEAIPVDVRKSEKIDLRVFFAQAEQAGRLYEWDRSFREAAIRGFPSRDGDVKLFLPVPAKIVFDPRLYPGSTLRRIEAANLRPEHVVLVILGAENEPESSIGSALKHYRNQGFRISLYGLEPRADSLRRIAFMQPEYVHANVGWMSGMAGDSVDESLLQALVGVARKERIVLIAAGPEVGRLVPALVAGGMSYAREEWNGEASGEERERQAAGMRELIRAEANKRFRGSSGTMAELAVPVKRFERQSPVSEVSRHFEKHRDEQCIVVAGEDDRPIGLLMKENLLQLLSGQFGLPLYWNRPVGKIMDAHPMVVEQSVAVDRASQMAMAREPDKLYDEVVVTRDGKLAGIASIRSMLEWTTQSRVNDAQWANPLTGLPGNEPIRKELVRRLAAGRPFDVLYADLDHFKWYNDRYGFQRGDEVIRYTGETLSRAIGSESDGDCFVGHIGGDDFIVLSSGMDALAAAKRILGQFAKGLGHFVDAGAGPALDREGRPSAGPALALSLSLLLCRGTAGWTPETLSERAALLKKKAKAAPGHSVEWEELGERYPGGDSGAILPEVNVTADLR